MPLVFSCTILLMVVQGGCQGMGARRTKDYGAQKQAWWEQAILGPTDNSSICTLELN